MSQIDWIVLIATLGFIVVYGVYKSRGQQNMDDYLLAGRSLPWYHVCLSVMATQASAITFLSAPGQGFASGMGFVQFYFGLPLAMVVLSITFVPIFHKLKVFTAYEFLENRFDARVRIFTASLFLISRGLATGLSIYAPSIILATILGWDIYWTNILMGSVVLIYTVSGGTKAISHTHLQQMFIVSAAMFMAGWMVVHLLPANMGFSDALQMAGKANRLNTIDFHFDPNSRYNIWSGLIGGFFLQLSYFGTDQSQVGRYLTGESIGQSRMGLMMNGLLKIPMQFLILLVGVLVFVYYEFHSAPIFFNKVETDKLKTSIYAPNYAQLQKQHEQLTEQKLQIAPALQKALAQQNNAAIDQYQTQIKANDEALKGVKKEVVALIKKNNPSGDTSDINYIFLRFVLDHLPVGLIGLLIAVIFSASMGSVAAAYNSLASTTVIDIYKRGFRPVASDAHYLMASRVATVAWGLFCIFIAQYASKLGSMIEAVNIVGSLFYGVILGIFLTAFYAPKIGAKATFWAAILGEIAVVACWYYDIMAFLWLNVVGCLLVVGFAWIIQQVNLKTS
ncbi:MAG: sodium:solute symporter [Cytophagia bacterium]|nr:MAG: sodium:solute symporter [Runella sp.]TAG22728.1 MAG: sodium:solute symporter [Cytophagales bacterium]TAG41804.1 MAG: sodium:solute symporter [Cytophagia bacterium]TAG50861.1 MAG: sodium:solute symporter [Runella slithyformis]TAG71148.1 MAG: sodium:solute symporter [Runella slithyformis]